MFIKPDQMILRRGGVVLLAAVALWIVIAVRLFFLQVIDYDKYHQKVIENITSKSTIKAPRGIIYDCNMTELAINSTVQRVFIAPNCIKDDDEKYLIARYLSDLLEVDYAKILEKAEKSWRADETIKNFVPKETADQIRQFIEDNDLDCVYLEDQSKRYYPFGTLAAQVIGFTNTDGVGLYGIESQYNDYLTGVAGKIITATNARGGSIPTKYESYTEAESGYNVVTTIDYKIQSILDKYVKESFLDNDSQNRCCGVIMDVKTGAVLAMSTYPTFDLNNPRELDEWFVDKLEQEYLPTSEGYDEKKTEYLMQMWNNKVVSDLYEPGSTFKIITTSMGFEEKVIDENMMFTCTSPYYLKLNDFGATIPIDCWHYGGHGEVTFRRGLQQSCNPTLMQAAHLIGIPTFLKYIQAYGYTSKTGIDLPGESKGIWHDEAVFHILELSTASFGQNFKTTAIQQLTAICTVANGGTLLTPYVVSKLIDDNGNIIKDCVPDPKRVLLSKDTCDRITDILEEGVSTDGAAKNAYVKGYKVAAKTGTSEKTDIRNEDGETYLRVGSCVAYAPAYDPQIAILIICDEPGTENIFGSVVAAPYLAKALAEILPYMNIDPVYSQEELASMEVNVSSYIGMSIDEARAAIAEKGLKCTVIGDGSIVSQQIPKSGSVVIQGSGNIVLYTEGTSPTESKVVPSLEGCSISGATDILLARGLNIILKGAIQSYSASDGYAQAVSQSIAPGTRVAPGTVVTVEFRFTNTLDG